MANAPAFVATPRVTSVNLASANTLLTGAADSGVAVTSLITGAASGTRVLEIDVQCAATSAAALVNVFISSDSGSTWRLFDQIAVSAATVSTTVKANRNLATYTNLILPSASYQLGVTTTIAQSTNVHCLAGDL